MTMTRKEARALIACATKLQKAVDSCLGQLGKGQKAEAYWAGRVRAIAGGVTYGSMPMEEAEKVLDTPSKYELKRARDDFRWSLASKAEKEGSGLL